MTTTKKDMKVLGYLGVDQHGNKYTISKHPRKELLEQLGRTKATKMYTDTTDNKTYHVGYVIAELWINVYTVCSWRKPA